MLLPVELLYCIYTFCDIDTRLKLTKIGIYKKFRVILPHLTILKPGWMISPRTQHLPKITLYAVINKNYILMYRICEFEMRSTQSFLIMCDTREKWVLDLKTNKWKLLE
jgi:hypothetical protein